jgi:hypothetical protein
LLAPVIRTFNHLIRRPQEGFMEEDMPPGISHDAVALLGFGPADETPLPEAAPGEVVIRYGGWSLRQLCDSDVVQARQLIWDQDWYNKHSWSREGMAAGIYRLRIPLPNSRKKTFNEQIGLLCAGEEAAPVCLVVTALLAHVVETGEDLLASDWTRCREQGSFGNRVSVRIGGGRLGLRYDYDDARHDGLRLSAFCHAGK